MLMDAKVEDLDLPLSANFHEVKVQHFVLDLSCSLETKLFKGIITMFCRATKHLNGQEENTMDSRSIDSSNSDASSYNLVADNRSSSFIIFDCYALDITACHFFSVPSDKITFDYLDGQKTPSHLQVPQEHMDGYYSIYKLLQCELEKFCAVTFTTHEHYVKVFLPQAVDKDCFFIIRIEYKTKLNGPSLMWTLDQDGRTCVFTIGHLLNNRSLFPSQDLPQAISSLHCSVTLLDEHTDSINVLMTGESEPEINRSASGEKIFNFKSSYKMPASTFALAIGHWSVTDMFSSVVGSNNYSDRSFLPHCRVFSPECLHKDSVDQLGKYLPLTFEALHSILGPYPLKHLDILIVPECFDSFGLASPHLLFLSQSLLCPDLSLFARLAHELCHTWFGILTGPRDWTEEWLTEGVCCYLEDKIHAVAMKWDAEESLARCELRALMKFRLLKSEISNTSEDLQTLRPNQGRLATAEEVCPQLFVKNGLNPEKTLMQVHYLKGFFLLRHLEHLAGTQTFLEVLKRFTSEHLGQLFSSKELLDYFFAHCLHLSSSGLTVAQVCEQWLDCSGLPKPLLIGEPVKENQLVKDVLQEVAITKAVASRKRGHSQSWRTNRATAGAVGVIQAKKLLLPEQLLLLLDMLIEEGIELTKAQLSALRTKHAIQEANAEVRHSWCELVIHRKASQWVNDIETFLLRHQALGVYLYGELMISENKKFQKLAKECFKRTQTFMPDGPKTIVQAMLFPT